MSKFAVIILAAGKGKRMGEGVPKVLRLLNGRPIISYLVNAIKESGVTEKPIIVVSPDHNLVQDFLGDSCNYVLQDKQLGTGHAALCARDFLEGKTEKVIIINGDQPLIKAQTIKKLHDKCNETCCDVTLFTTEVEDFEDWRKTFFNFGRIIRNEEGKILAIREKKDSSPVELEIKEVNPGLMCFNADWLWQHLEKLGNDNAQQEYYLTDLIQMAMDENINIESVKINPEECVGVNTPEELELVNKLWHTKINFQGLF